MLTGRITITRALKQGMGWAPTLINIALEYVIRKLIMNSSNILFNKGTQAVAYADDVIIMEQTMRVAKETLN